MRVTITRQTGVVCPVCKQPIPPGEPSVTYSINMGSFRRAHVHCYKQRAKAPTIITDEQPDRAQPGEQA